jgi:hypothetical protein
MKSVTYSWQLLDIFMDDVIGVQWFHSYSYAREHQKGDSPIYLVRKTSRGAMLVA